MPVETSELTFVRTKVQRPRLPGDLIPRRRLLERLHAGSHRKLTLISAMAGTGKTTLMAQWLEVFPTQRLAFVGRTSNDRIVFLTYLCGQSHGVPHWLYQSTDLLHAPQTPSGREIMTLIVNELARLL